MKALQYTGSLPGYAATMALGRISRAACWGPLSCLKLRDVPEPSIPGPDWAVVKTRLAGICGSDLHLVMQETSPAASAFTSFPFTIGHENVGVLVEAGEGVGPDLTPGRRVVVDPLLPCVTRGIDPPCPSCRAGNYAVCENTTCGTLAPGMLIGSCRDTGGTWSPLFLAHKTQLFTVPDSVSDAAAVLTEPLAVALHAVMTSAPGGVPGEVPPEGATLVIGGGVIGLGVLASLRFLGDRSRVIALVRHEHQAGLAGQFGADEVVMAGSGWEDTLAGTLGARLLKPVVGRRVPTTGANRVFECAGSRSALDTALRFAAPGGEVVLVGLAAAPPGIDWSHVWRKELRIQGAFCYGWEEVVGRRERTFDTALRMLSSGMFELEKLVTHRFRLEDYRKALRILTDKGSSRAVKAVFVFD